MGGITDGIEDVRHSLAHRLRIPEDNQPAASSKRGSPSVVVFWTIFRVDHVVPAVAEVIGMIDRLGAGLLNDVAEPAC